MFDMMWHDGFGNTQSSLITNERLGLYSCPSVVTNARALIDIPKFNIRAGLVLGLRLRLGIGLEVAWTETVSPPKPLAQEESVTVWLWVCVWGKAKFQIDQHAGVDR